VKYFRKALCRSAVILQKAERQSPPWFIRGWNAVP